MTLLVLAGYILETCVKPNELGLTTEVAAIATFLLGAMATLGHSALAVGLAIATAAIAGAVDLGPFAGGLCSHALAWE